MLFWLHIIVTLLSVAALVQRVKDIRDLAVNALTGLHQAGPNDVVVGSAQLNEFLQAKSVSCALGNPVNSTRNRVEKNLRGIAGGWDERQAGCWIGRADCSQVRR